MKLEENLSDKSGQKENIQKSKLWNVLKSKRNNRKLLKWLIMLCQLLIAAYRLFGQRAK